MQCLTITLNNIGMDLITIMLVFAAAVTIVFLSGYAALVFVSLIDDVRELIGKIRDYFDG